jgi:hypothetical protein
VKTEGYTPFSSSANPSPNALASVAKLPRHGSVWPGYLLRRCWTEELMRGKAACKSALGQAIARHARGDFPALAGT